MAINLSEVKAKLEAKERVRQQIIGQREMLMDNMKNAGFETFEEVEIALENLQKEYGAMSQKYEEGVALFMEKYKGLLS